MNVLNSLGMYDLLLLDYQLSSQEEVLSSCSLVMHLAVELNARGSFTLLLINHDSAPS